MVWQKCRRDPERTTRRSDSKGLTIQEQPKVETEKLGSLKDAVNKLQEELTQQKMITETVSEENLNLKERIGKTEEKLERTVHEILEQTN